MSVLHDEFLADYASGTLSPGMSLLAAAQLTLSAEARARVDAFESLGGALLEAAEADATALPADAVPPPSLDRALAMLDAPEAADAPAPTPADPAPGAPGVLPAVLRRALGVDEASAPWSFRLPGLSEAVFDGYEGEEVSLLRARPGAPMFSHTHEGVEATLVLCGAMEDRGRVLRRGDLAFATAEDDHRPRILDEGVCICFVVNTGRLRFTGPFSRALNLFAE